VLDREKAPIGVFLTLEQPTRPMEKEAASAGFYTLGDRQYPRLQIITVEQALNGLKPAIPLIDTGLVQAGGAGGFYRAAQTTLNECSRKSCERLPILVASGSQLLHENANSIEYITGLLIGVFLV
jgi:hypothetical protein